MKKRLEALWCALFRVNKNATGYTWPICRILLCLLSYWLLTVVNGSRPMSTPRAVVFVLLIVLTWGLLRRYMRTGGDQHRPEAPQIPQDQAAGIGPGEGCRKALFPGAAGSAGGGE